MSRDYKGLFPCGSRTKTFNLYLAHAHSIPSHRHDLITPNNIRRGVNITKLIIMEFSTLSSYFLHLKPKYLIHRPILDHPRPMRFS